MKKLVLAEKPSVGREIAKVLKCNNNKGSYIEGKDYVITWALGHLVELQSPEDYENIKRYLKETQQLGEKFLNEKFPNYYAKDITEEL